MHTSAAAGAAREMKGECEELGATSADRGSAASGISCKGSCAVVLCPPACPDWLAISGDGSQDSDDEIPLLQRVSNVILGFVGYSA